MTESPPTTSFDLIEDHKENIQPLSSGRSARALANSFSPLSSNPHAARSIHYAKQSEFEQELNHAQELDDPLEAWLRYINWTVETFPSGNSSDSGLLSLLERVTKEFLHDSHYKNDLRYLKLWIQYARDFSDAPREIFAYLSRHGIGQKLALFYEDYAALLESMGKRKQAAEVYQSGIENSARPVERLHRKFEEFRHRLSANTDTVDEEPSPVLSAIRPALAAKPLGATITGANSSEELIPQRSSQTSQPRPVKPKMTIFSDVGQPSSTQGLPSKDPAGWENIGSLHHRKKENTPQPIPWAGETLKQVGSRKPTESDRLMVFRDGNSVLATHPVVLKTKSNERIAVNLDLVYPEEEDQEEFSFEELRAIKLGLYGVDWNMQRESEIEAEDCQWELSSKLERSRTPVKVKTVLSPSPNKERYKRKNRAPSSPTMTFHTKAATDEIYSLFNQPLKTNERIDRDDASDQSDSRNNSEEDDFTAISHVDHTIPLDNREDLSSPEENDAESIHSDWSDFALRRSDGIGMSNENIFSNEGIQSTAQNLQKLSIFNDESPKQTSNNSRKIRIPSPPQDFDPPKLPYHVAKDQFQMQSRLPYMTPIVEKTESLPPTTLRGRALHAAKTPSRTRTYPPLDETEMLNCALQRPSRDFHPTSSPAHPSQESSRSDLSLGEIPPKTHAEPLIQDILCNPLDESLRSTILSKLLPPLKSYIGYYEHPQSTSGRTSEIKKIGKAMSKREGERPSSLLPKPPLLSFITGDGGSSYEVVRELGRGAFAPVYLVQNLIIADAEDEEDFLQDQTAISDRKLNGRKRWEALKMEEPPTPWEFYIMRQAQKRLANTRSSQSIIQAHELHMFSDEGFLILEYLDQGTILDLINISRSDPTNTSGTVMDESLVMFLTIELLRTIEELHVNGIIHGDLKADNCLIRFNSLSDSEWTSRYHNDGSGGWSQKGVSFIDFGRGIDMTLFAPHVQFVADWKTDQQDCAEMQEMRPWTYQVDYHGLASIIHSMLFGKYIETVAERSSSVGGATNHYKIMSPFKRYWQQELWTETFDMLLNPLRYVKTEPTGNMPITTCLKDCRTRMEDWLVSHADKGVGLKNQIRKMEMLLGAKRK
ncbi:Mad3/BUB1 homology region 1-domain-containing protein [Geopyxis carbonaria]|nr:Mad3/BUB1 homology region 1-domain-containing protein [Geopyxis carbonaria]